MSDTVIRAEGLSKLYRLGPRQRYGSLRDSVAELAKRPFRRGRRPPVETIWALRDVSFEVARGDVVGIIGRNGAGKSTLLKILSRITEPTEGRAEVLGRVGSLLEVGTGFHPELTGRENVYLNGAILGMKRAEIERRFDEIVAFAEVEKFLDTQMKFYSSGMYVRLAFAVAAHLEPEILIVDEVLAVGDTGFQKKCLGKMGEVASAGRTVLLVSHNMGAVEHLCRSALLLEEGSVRARGPASDVVDTYIRHIERQAETSAAGVWDLAGIKRSPGLRPVLTRLTISAGRGEPTGTLSAGSPTVMTMEYDTGGRELLDPHFAIRVESAHGQPLFFLRTRIQGPREVHRLPARGIVRCLIDRLPLTPTTYALTLGVTERGVQLDMIESAVRFTVGYRDFFGTGELPHPAWGPVLVDCRWEVAPSEDPTGG